MALTEAQRRANDKYIKEHYTAVKLSMPNSEAEVLDSYCSAKGYTKAGFIRQAIKEKMERDTASATAPIGYTQIDESCE